MSAVVSWYLIIEGGSVVRIPSLVGKLVVDPKAVIERINSNAAVVTPTIPTMLCSIVVVDAFVDFIRSTHSSRRMPRLAANHVGSAKINGLDAAKPNAATPREVTATDG